MSHQVQKKVIIIGAGVAGLSAAKSLIHSGYKNVQIFEATDVIGGRISTTAVGNGWGELGAQWIHGEDDNTAYKTALQHNLIFKDGDLRELYKNIFCSDDGSQIDESLVNEVVEALTDSLDRTSMKDLIDKYNQNMNIDEYLNIEMEKLINRSKPSPAVKREMNGLLNWFKAFQSSIDGCDSLKQLSTTSFREYKECEGNILTNFKHGYISLVNLLASKIPPATVHLNKAVDEINLLPNGNGVRVICSDSSVNYADHVIVTVSLGYLKQHANKLFKPALPPAKLQTIENLEFGTVNKIFLEFESSFWPASCTGYCIVWKDDKNFDHPDHKWGKAIFGFYTVPFASNVLCGWLVGEEARHMETLSDDEVKATCLYLLKRFTGIANIPSLKSIKRSKWYSHPFVCGSYSFLSSKQPSNNELAKPVYENRNGEEIPIILFAGEATHPYYYSTVHGAMDSGIREADRIIQLYGGSNFSHSKL
ncbi:hypothetical protein CHUAL_011209 [Chamberlinius hualienensis]